MAAIVFAGLVGCASSTGERPIVTKETKSAMPGWGGYADPRYEDHLGSAVWNGQEMVMVALADHDANPEHWRNIVAAYDPASGSWHDLPKLPTDDPVTTNSVEMSKPGVVVAGLACDPKSWHQEDAGRYCEPSSLRTFLQPTGEDAFIEIDPPADARPEQGIPSLVQGTRNGSPFLSYGEKLYRLTDDRTWELQHSGLTNEPLCQLGDRIIGGDGHTSLATFDPKSQRSTPLDLPTPHGNGTLHCGDGTSALYTIRPGAPATSTAYLITSDEPPAKIAMPPTLSPENITFDGASFITSGALIKPLAPGESPDALARTSYLFDRATGRLRETTHPLQPGQSIDAYPLDGTVALYGTSTGPTCPTDGSRPCHPPEHHWQVQRQLKPAD